MDRSVRHEFRPRSAYLTQEQLRATYAAKLERADSKPLASARLSVLERAQKLDTALDAFTLRASESL